MNELFERWKARSERGKAFPLRVGAYGKLPLYEDFLRNRVTGDGPLALKRWLDQGFSRFWGATEQRKNYEIRPHLMLLQFDRRLPPIASYLWGSHDSGGLRRFPFVFFSEIPRKIARRGTLILLDVLDQFASQCEGWQGAVATFSNAEEFNRWARDLECRVAVRRPRTVRKLLQRTTANLTVNDFATSCYGDDAAARWPALLAYLDRQAQRSSSVGLSLRLPSPTILPMWARLAVWHILLRQRRRRMPVANFMHPVNPDGADVVILERPLRADDVYLFHPQTDDYDFVEDLRRSVPTVGEPPAAMEDSDKERLLSDILRAARRHKALSQELHIKG